MKLKRIEYGNNQPFIIRGVHEITTHNAALVLVPDEETLHELQGLALIANMNLLVRVLEPGKPLPWDKGMSSPWYVDTDKYHMSFGLTDTCHTPHLLFNCL